MSFSRLSLLLVSSIWALQVNAVTPQEIEAVKQQHGAGGAAAGGVAEQGLEYAAASVGPTSTRVELDAETGLAYFGYDLFSRYGQGMTAAQDTPVPQDYVLNVGDQIKVTIYGKSTQKHLLFVNRDGSVDLPDIGNLSAAGMKFDQFVQDVTQKIQEKFTGAKSNITLGKVSSMRVLVLGDAVNPGSYQVSSLASITQALQAAGGIKLSGSLRKVSVKRGGKTVATIDLYDLLLRGDNRDDVRLQNGDTVFVAPVGSRVAIKGGVNRPGIYETSGSVSLSEALALAGGYRGDAVKSSVSLSSTDSKGRRVTVSVNSNQKVTVHPGDVVYVPLASTAQAVANNQIRLSGEVNNAGIFGWYSGMRLIDALPSMDLLKPTADLTKVMVRSLGLDGQYRTRIVNMAAALANPAGSDNITLSSQDELVFLGAGVSSVSSNALFNELNKLGKAGVAQDYVSVVGAVKRPGTYHYSAKDLLAVVEAAGGLSEDYQQGAYPLFTVVIRRDVLTGSRKMIAYDLKQVVTNKLSVDIKSNDIVVLLSKKEIDYINSADIKDVFNGKRPSSYAINVNSSALSSTQDSKLSENDLALGLASSDMAMFKKQQQQQQQQQQGCAGIDQLAQSLSTGIGRNFAQLRAMMTSGSSVGGSSFQQVLSCPVLFNDYPELLAFTLESSVMVDGEVRRSALLPVTETTRLQDVIEVLGGFTNRANVTQVEQTRLSTSMSPTLRQFIDLSRADFLNSLVQPGDVFLIRPLENDIEKGTVTLGGEVKYPGNYVIKKGETLSQLIARAGGLTDFAYPYGAVFTREKVRAEQQSFYDKTIIEMQEAMFAAQQMRRDQPTTSVVGMDAMMKSLMESMKTTAPIGRMVIEADPLVLAAKPEFDLQLEPGDRLFVPKRSQHVTVTGQVLNMGSVIQRSEFTAKDYISKAGGVTRMADADNAFLILPNGEAQPVSLSNWSMSNDSIPPGSTLYVPRDPLPFNAMGFGIDISKILSSLAISAASVAVINR